MNEYSILGEPSFTSMKMVRLHLLVFYSLLKLLIRCVDTWPSIKRY